MSVNPNGYVPITDGGTPRIITAFAKEIISGGQFVGASGAAGVVDSGTSSFKSTDIEVYLTAGSGNFIGVALDTVISGAVISIATRGSILAAVSGAIVLAGTKVNINDDSEVIVAGSANQAYAAAETVGRVWTTGSDSEFVVLDIHG